MPEYCEIRAEYTSQTITVYQAYCRQIAELAIQSGKFVKPFSFNRMSWIKPSFLWLMERSNWGLKSNQEWILGIRIKRSFWDSCLESGVLTNFQQSIHGSGDRWRREFRAANVHVQWDPERTIHGKKLSYRAIQVGLTRDIVREEYNNAIVEIVNLTPTVEKLRQFRRAGKFDRLKKQLPAERVYPVSQTIQARLGMHEKSLSSK